MADPSEVATCIAMAWRPAALLLRDGLASAAAGSALRYARPG